MTLDEVKAFLGGKDSRPPALPVEWSGERRIGVLLLFLLGRPDLLNLSVSMVWILSRRNQFFRRPRAARQAALGNWPPTARTPAVAHAPRRPHAAPASDHSEVVMKTLGKAICIAN